MRFGVVQPLRSPLRANNDGAKIRPEGDVTAEEGTNERGTRTRPLRVAGVGFALTVPIS